jgi:predicted MFS family arabinose efflux permease
MAGFFGDTFAALRHRNFRYWWFGQCVSLMGTWMQRTAQIWLVYSMTKSPVLLGLLGVFQSGPVLLLSIPAGVYVDRFPKRRIIILTQTIFTIQAFAMAALTWSGKAQYWQILVLATIFGVTTAFDNPGRQSFYIHLVGKEDLLNAISLNSTIVNLAKIVGPSVAGVVMATLGPAPCFFLNGVTFLAVIYGLTRITVDGVPRADLRNNGRVWTQALQGITYIWRNQTLRLTAMLVTIQSVFSHNTNVIIPVFTDRVLNLGVTQYGFLMSLNGLGALLGALAMASRAKHGVRGSFLLWTMVCLSAVQVLVSLSRGIVPAGFLIALIGALNIAFSNTANSTLQLGAQDDFRGRVMAFYMLVHNGATPLGNAFAGGMMQRFGGAAGFLSGGLASLLLVGVLLLTQRQAVRTTLLANPGTGGQGHGV